MSEAVNDFCKPEDFVMPFGKWKDETLGDIQLHSPGYLRWLWENLSPGDVLNAVEQLYEKGSF